MGTGGLICAAWCVSRAQTVCVQVRSNGVIDFNFQLASPPCSANGFIDTGVYLPVP
jgi:hypothetical protein